MPSVPRPGLGKGKTVIWGLLFQNQASLFFSDHFTVQPGKAKVLQKQMKSQPVDGGQQTSCRARGNQRPAQPKVGRGQVGKASRTITLMSGRQPPTIPEKVDNINSECDYNELDKNSPLHRTATVIFLSLQFEGLRWIRNLGATHFGC